MALTGETFRRVNGRLTQRVKIGNQFYFLKQHTRTSWKEILKNMLQLRWPVTSAVDEFKAITKLQTLGVQVPDIAAYGKRGVIPTTQQSFILLEELAPAVSLEDLAKQWQSQPPTFQFKQALIRAVAKIARTIHINGINHRDFYICHFLLQGNEVNNLYLIDLHRAQLRKATPLRWVIKDLAGLYFSSKDSGLTSRDLLRFMAIYSNQSWREVIKNGSTLWDDVKQRGEKLYRDHQ
jgi:heptose I phosphotransferase